MRLEVLGCAGGIGGHERLTTCLLVDDDILLDAGTGLASLDLERLSRINHVFLTHSHLDHVAGLALLVDAVMGRRRAPITVYATAPIIEALKTHLFNWVLWPDFTTIPNEREPALRWQVIQHDETVSLGERQLTAFPVNHMNGSAAYWVRTQRDGFLFTGDMRSTPQLWNTVIGKSPISKVIVECSFTNADRALSDLSMHFCPQTLIDEVRTMPGNVEFLIYHLKPGQEDLIMQELKADPGRRYRAVRCSDVFEF